MNLDTTGQGAKDPPTLLQPSGGLHNFESVFIIIFIRDCPKAELELIMTAS